MDHLYLVEIDGVDYPVAVRQDGTGLHVRVGDGPDRHVDFSLAQEPAIYSLLVDGRSRQVRVVPDPEQPGYWQLSMRQQRVLARVQTERERRLSRVAGAKQTAGGELTVKAPMPGLVRAVAVAVGDTVQQGQRLLLLEAMKMENDIQAPRAGTVKDVKVAQGDTVENGRPLVVLE
ncbi:MAG TPA: biotin/lipoyl-containing protein [Chloroflexia bacterium]|nr:biotin/lipoyl-containing protein [Chloroflexia bacterium]